MTTEAKSRPFVGRVGGPVDGPIPRAALDQMECFGVVPHRQKFVGSLLAQRSTPRQLPAQFALLDETRKSNHHTFLRRRRINLLRNGACTD